jgi:hypothetical protein
VILRSALVSLACLLAGVAIADDWRDGYVLGSRVNARATTQTGARIVAALTVGTAVRYRAAGNGACEVALFEGSTGFLPCTLLTGERPTLASIDAALAVLTPGSEQEDDWLARRFYLSPSLRTLELVAQRKGFESAASSTPSGAATFAALLDAFRGDVTGAAFAPVDLQPNATVATTLRALAPQRVAEAPTTDLPPARPSLFRTPLDVLVIGRARPDGADGNAARHVKALAADDGARDILEFAKLYRGQRFNVRHLDDASRDDGPIPGWGRTTGLGVELAVRATGFVLARNRPTAASIGNIAVQVAQSRCGDAALSVAAELEQPMFAETGLLVALAPGAKVTQAARMPESTNPALFDFDGDATPDLAYATFAVDGDLSPTLQHTVVLVNIAGTWRVARTLAEQECD